MKFQATAAIGLLLAETSSRTLGQPWNRPSGVTTSTSAESDQTCDASDTSADLTD